MNKRRLLLSIVIAFILVTVLLVWIDIMDICRVLFSIPSSFIVLGFILYVVSYFLMTLRFWILLNRKLGFKELFSIVCIHNMLNSIIPARIGELSYVYLIKRKNFSTGKGITTLMVARIFDFIAISMLFSLSILSAERLPSTNLLSIIAVFLVLSVLSLISLFYMRDRFIGVVERIILRFNLTRFHFVIFLMDKSKDITECFEAINSKRILLYSFLTSILLCTSLYIAYYILIKGMGLNLAMELVILAVTFSILTTILPFQGVGGFGTTEVGWTVGFIAVGLSKDMAIVSGFSTHIICFIYILFLGAYGMVTLNRS